MNFYELLISHYLTFNTCAIIIFIIMLQLCLYLHVSLFITLRNERLNLLVQQRAEIPVKTEYKNTQDYWK